MATTFEQLWLSMVAKRPLLADEQSTVTITAKRLRELLHTFYEKGKEAGEKEISFFDRIFGAK